MVVRVGILYCTHLQNTKPKNRLDNYLDTILDKVAYVYENNDVIFWAGDVFNAYVISQYCVNRVQLLIGNYERQGKVTKMLEGNHDIICRNTSSIIQTSYGNLLLNNDRELNKPYIVENVAFVPLQQDMVIPDKNPDMINILLGHAYYNCPERNDPLNIMPNTLKGYEFCVLGHDHAEYEPVNDNGTIILRSGSLSRNSMDKHNLTRIPKYTQFIIDNGKIVDFGYKEVPCEPADVIFKAVTTDVTKKKYRMNISEVIDSLKIKKDTNKLTFNEILNEINTPKDVISLIGQIQEEDTSFIEI